MTGVAAMTAFYMFRLYYGIFWGTENKEAHEHHTPHEAPPAHCRPSLQDVPALHRAAYKRFYQDEIWQFVTHKIIFRCVSRPIAWFDRHVIDGTFNFMAWGANEAGESLRPWQSGDVRQYAVWFLTGTVALTLICSL